MRKFYIGQALSTEAREENAWEKELRCYCFMLIVRKINIILILILFLYIYVNNQYKLF